MHRLLVKVRHKRLKRQYRDKNGLACGRYALRVRVEGSAIGALKVPEGLVGREASLTRDFLLPWGVKVGDLLVLDPAESARVLCRRRPSVSDGCSRTGRPEVQSGDVDRDGYPEDILTNAFIRAVVQPHRGARIQSLCDCDGVDRFAQPFDYIMGGKLILLGGAEELIVESGSPGDMWKAGFRRDEPSEGSDAVEIGYSHKLTSPDGMNFSKRVRVERGLPGVLVSYAVSYSGKSKRDEETEAAAGERPDRRGRADDRAKAKEDDRTDVTFCVRVSTPVLGEVGSRNVFDVPGPSGLTLVRYHRPGYGRRWRWRDWRDEHFGLSAGFVLSRHEELDTVMAVLFGPRKAAHVSIRCDYQGPELHVSHARRKIAKGRKQEYGLAFLVGHAVAASVDSMLVLTRGRAGRGGLPVSITLRTRRRIERARATLLMPGGRKTATLVRRDLAGAGHVYTRSLRLPRASFPMSCAVTVGSERLSVDLEA